jgi:hypothetical protein
MPRSRSIFIQSERVWIRLLLGLHFAGKLDRAAEQQKLFGQRRLARVRVRDDREGAAAADFLCKWFGHRGRIPVDGAAF